MRGRKWVECSLPVRDGDTLAQMRLPSVMSHVEWEHMERFMALAKPAFVNGYERWPDAVGDGAVVMLGPEPKPHPEDRCERCGQRNVKAWSVASALWNRVTEKAGLDRNVIWCPQCFTEEYERQESKPPVWELVLKNAEPPR